MKKRYLAHKGFSLLELLLVVLVLSVLMAGALKIFDDWAKTSLDQEVAQEILQLQMAAEAYVDLNFNSLIDNHLTATGLIHEIVISTDLIANGFLPAGYQAINSFNQPMRVIARRADNAAYGPVIEVITLSDTVPRQENRLFSAARAGGSKLGVLACRDLNSGVCLTAGFTIRSASGAWAVPLSDLSSLYSTVPNANGGYMAAYGRITDEQVLTDQYLFRVEDADFADANRMQTNLRMNSNDIVNAGIIVADQVNVSGSARFDGIASGGVSSPYVLSVEDNFETQEMDIRNPADNGRGNLIVEGEGTSTLPADFNVANNITVNLDGNNGGTGTVSATTFETNGLDMPGSNPQAAFGTLNLNGQNLVASGTTPASGQIYSSGLQFGNRLDTDGLQVNDPRGGLNSIATDRLVAGTITTRGNATISGNMDVQNTFATENLDAGSIIGSNRMTIDNMNCGDNAACPQ